MSTLAALLAALMSLLGPSNDCAAASDTQAATCAQAVEDSTPAESGKQAGPRGSSISNGF